ncbi:hypothetical protein [Blastococcus sp. SYSU D00813]
MTPPEPVKVRKPPPRTGAVGRDLRRLVEERLAAELSSRGWRQGRRKGTWTTDAGMEPPLVARLTVDVDTMRAQVVRVAAAVAVVVPEVEELLSGAPDASLTRFQVSYPDHGHPLARADLGEVDGVARQRPLDWQARDESQLGQAVTGFLDHLDGPVRRWLDERAGVAALLGAADADGSGGAGERTRAAAALEALRGDPAAARARLARYRERPDSGDGAEQVDAFTAWLEPAVAGRGAGG